MRNLLFVGPVLFGLALTVYSRAAEAVSIEGKGRISASSTNGSVRLDAFYIVNRVNNRPPLGLYWIIKPGTRQVLMTWSSNHVVDAGWTLCSFDQAVRSLYLFHGLTNVADPYSEGEMRKQYGILSDALAESGAFPNTTRFDPESKLPEFALVEPPKAMGFCVRISDLEVTASNITVKVAGAGASARTNTVGRLVFDLRTLNFVGASVVTNHYPRPKDR